MIVNVVVEGRSDEQAARRVVTHVGHEVSRVIDKRGKSRLDPLIPNYNSAAKGQPYIVFRDSDGECPVELRRRLLAGVVEPQKDFILRLAHTMTEAWLLADRQGFADHFGVSLARVPRNPDSEQHAKRAVLTLCRHSRIRSIREGMVASRGETGPLYVDQLNRFAKESWDVAVAADESESLRRALQRIRQL